jgi:hypothetical protein
VRKKTAGKKEKRRERKEKKKGRKNKEKEKMGKFSKLGNFWKIKDNLRSWWKIIFVKEWYMPNYK